jgi:pilus assembly protein CpaB
LLRRTQNIVLKDETETQDAPVPRAVNERRGLGALRTDSAPAAPTPEPAPPEPAPAVEENLTRWREEIPEPIMSPEHRRNLERWRAEVLQSVASSDDDDGAPSRWKTLFKPANVALIAVALIAGGGDAFLATQQGGPAPAPAPVVAAAPEPVTQIVEEAKVQVLVAKTPIKVGQRLNASVLEWVEWPEDTTRSDFFTQTAQPEALQQMDNAVARYEFFPGEPIREIKLARADQGLLSAVLEPGTRAVSVSVPAESASGGFILPNDRVDIVLTAAVANKQISSTILKNIRVLAINSEIGETAATKGKKADERNSGESDKPEDEKEPAGPVTFASAIATLALDPQQAEVIIAATLSGRLSLVLRPTADAAKAETDAREQAANEAIRISSPFWSN